MGDDYTNGGLFMFVADKEKDLSAGTLYVAKYTTVLSDTTTGQISWIRLGHATSAEIENLIKSGIKGTDILSQFYKLLNIQATQQQQRKRLLMQATKVLLNNKL